MTRRAPATERLTVAQALVRFLAAQRVERDGVERPFFAGVFGIFGHGNVAGIGQALQQYASRMRYYQSRNEQAQVHAAAAYARMTNRLQILACTSSVGPGATNMITGAAGATINRLPVLLLPGDVFATRRVGTVLQQLEAGWSQEVSVNDAFRPVSRYWDRISRPEQLIHAALEAMRVLTSQAETGAVTLALPQDVQAEAFDWPAEFLQRADLARPPATAGPGRAGSRGRSDPAVGAAADRRGRRRHLLRGDRGAPRAGRDHRDPGGGDAGREGLAFLRPPVEPRRHGSHRHTRRQPYRARGRPGNRHRHAVQRLHHRVADRISAPGRPVRQPQHRRARRLQARGSRAAGRRPGHPRGPPRVTCRLGRGSGLARGRGAIQPRVGPRGGTDLPARTSPAAQPGGNRGRRQPERRGEGCGRMRGRQSAGGPAQAVADPGPQRLPRRVRLLLHGLRGRRRARGEDGRARSARCT